MAIPLYFDYQASSYDPLNKEYMGDINIANSDVPNNIVQPGSFDFYIGPLDAANSIFPTFAQGIIYQSTAASTGVLNTLNANFGAGYFSYAGLIRDPVDNFLTVNSALTITTSSFTPALVGTGATGSQLSSTKSGKISATFKTSTTGTLTGNNASLVTAKICATNNSTEASWTTAGSTGNDQPSGISVTIGQVISGTGQITFDVPAGWYYKFVNTGAGTHSETVVSGQKTIFG